MQDKIRVLITDDDTAFADEVKDTLEKASGFSVLGIARDGAEGVEMTKRLKPDIVLMDIVMPKKDGISALCEIKALPIPVRPQVVMLSAAMQDSTMRMCITSGADYCMMKPIDPVSLTQRLRGVCRPDSPPPSAMPASTPDPEAMRRTIERSVTDTIHSVGIPANIKGIIINKRTRIGVT